MIGYINASNANMDFSGNTVENVVLTQSFEHNYKQINSGELVDNFAFISGNSGTYTPNTITNVTIIPGIAEVDTIEAFASAINQGGVIPVKDGVNLTVPSSVEITKPVSIVIPANSTIDFGSNQLRNKSDMTVKGDGNVTGSAFVLINDGGTMTIEGGNFKTTSTNLNYQPVRSEAGSLIINGGYFESQAGAAVLTNYVNDKTGNLVINGGTFVNKNSGQYVLHFNGDGELTVNGGTFVGVFGCARVESSSYSDKKARATFNGGTFICTESYYALAVDAEGSSNGSVVTVTGGNYWSKNTTLYSRTSTNLIIKGGKFKSLNNYSVADGATVSDINETETITLPDGTSVEANYLVEVK